VDSVDLEAGAHQKRWFDVRTYDGRTLPFPDEHFDVIFSSNVLEHIRDLDAIFGELLRVARKNALHIHLLPSSPWRFWTSVAHYPYLVARFVFGRGGQCEAAPPSAANPARRRWWRRVWRAVVPVAHGEYSSSFAELWYFSARRWRREFRRHGFEVVEQYPASVFYTGYTLLPKLSLKARRRLAAVAGSGCNAFVLRRRGGKG
jgi:SAM-dependent methyltransferase